MKWAVNNYKGKKKYEYDNLHYCSYCSRPSAERSLSALVMSWQECKVRMDSSAHSEFAGNLSALQLMVQYVSNLSALPLMVQYVSNLSALQLMVQYVLNLSALQLWSNMSQISLHCN